MEDFGSFSGNEGYILKGKFTSDKVFSMNNSLFGMEKINKRDSSKLKDIEKKFNVSITNKTKEVMEIFEI